MTNTLVTSTSSGVCTRRRTLLERGMATAEYAVGILAAVALALVLLHIFTDQDFFEVLLKFVVDLIGKAAAMIS